METRASPSTKLRERISEIAAYMERVRGNVTLHKKWREGEEREMKRGKKKRKMTVLTFTSRGNFVLYMKRVRSKVGQHRKRRDWKRGMERQIEGRAHIYILIAGRLNTARKTEATGNSSSTGRN